MPDEIEIQFIHSSDDFYRVLYSLSITQVYQVYINYVNSTNVHNITLPKIQVYIYHVFYQ